MQEFINRPSDNGQPSRIVFVGPLTNNTTYKILKDHFHEKLGDLGDHEIFKSKNKGKNKNCFALVKVSSDLDYTRLLVTSHNILGRQVRTKDFVQNSLENCPNPNSVSPDESPDSLMRRVYF